MKNYLRNIVEQMKSAAWSSKNIEDYGKFINVLVPELLKQCTLVEGEEICRTFSIELMKEAGVDESELDLSSTEKVTESLKKILSGKTTAIKSREEKIDQFKKRVEEVGDQLKEGLNNQEIKHPIDLVVYRLKYESLYDEMKQDEIISKCFTEVVGMNLMMIADIESDMNRFYRGAKPTTH